jgi:hypothetical protein
MAMPRLIWLLVLLATAGAARADEGRNVPALGSKLTYRFVATTTLPTRTIVAGEVYTQIVTKVDKASAEGIIKPRALIIHCKDGAADPGCKSPAQKAGAHLDGDLLTIPIADDVGDALAKLSSFKYAYFMQETRKVPVPGGRDATHPDLADIGPEPTIMLTNSYQCEFDRLASFVPIGRASHIALPCATIFERSASRDGRVPPMTARNKVTFDVTYTGDGRVTLPSGNWEVKKLAVKLVPDDPQRPSSEGESLFSPQLGIIIKPQFTASNPATHAKTESNSELISVEP